MSAALWAGDASVDVKGHSERMAARTVRVSLAGTGIIALQQRFADCTGGVCTGWVFQLCWGMSPHGNLLWSLSFTFIKKKKLPDACSLRRMETTCTAAPEVNP
jgi:hypothetical protein